MYAFKKIGRLVIRPREGVTYDELWDDVLNAGALDFQPSDASPSSSPVDLVTAVSPEYEVSPSTLPHLPI